MIKNSVEKPTKHCVNIRNPHFYSSERYSIIAGKLIKGCEQAEQRRKAEARPAGTR